MERFVGLGVVFVVAVFVALVLVQAGIVRNPVTLGLVVTGAGVLLLLAYWLEKLGVLAGEALGIFFVIALGLFFIAYGLIASGLLPATATGEEGLILSAFAYTLLAILALLTLYLLAKIKLQRPL